MKLEVIKDVIGQPYVAMVFSQSRDNADVIIEYLNKLRDYTIGLYGDDIYYKLLMKFKHQRDGLGHFHITVFNSMECKKYPYLLMFNGVDINTPNEFKGIGTIKSGGAQTFYVIVENTELTSILNVHELNPKHFHITLGFNPKDLFTEPKTVDTLIIS